MEISKQPFDNNINTLKANISMEEVIGLQKQRTILECSINDF
jgi:hypothetical protein